LREENLIEGNESTINSLKIFFVLTSLTFAFFAVRNKWRLSFELLWQKGYYAFIIHNADYTFSFIISPRVCQYFLFIIKMLFKRNIKIDKFWVNPTKNKHNSQLF